MAGGSVALMGEAGPVGSGLLLLALLVAGTVVVIAVLGAFLFGERFARPAEPLSREEYEELRRRAETRISALAPGAILLSERERVAGAEERGPVVGEFWRRFGGVSGLVEEDPAAALRELRDLPALLEQAFEDVDRANGSLKSVGAAEEDER